MGVKETRQRYFLGKELSDNLRKFFNLTLLFSRLHSVQDAVGDWELVLRVVWAVGEDIVALLDEVLDVVLDYVDLALDLALETDVIDVGLLNLLAIAIRLADGFLMVSLLEDFLGDDPGGVDHHVLDIVHGGDAIGVYVSLGISPDTISAGNTVLASLFERMVNILNSAPLVVDLVSKSVTVVRKLLLVGPLVAEALEVGAIIDVL